MRLRMRVRTRGQKKSKGRNQIGKQPVRNLYLLESAGAEYVPKSQFGGGRWDSVSSVGRVYVSVARARGTIIRDVLWKVDDW